MYLHTLNIENISVCTFGLKTKLIRRQTISLQNRNGEDKSWSFKP